MQPILPRLRGRKKANQRKESNGPEEEEEEDIEPFHGGAVAADTFETAAYTADTEENVDAKAIEATVTTVAVTTDGNIRREPVLGSSEEQLQI